jgi:hypothetical protein
VREHSRTWEHLACSQHCRVFRERQKNSALAAKNTLSGVHSSLHSVRGVSVARCSPGRQVPPGTWRELHTGALFPSYIMPEPAMVSRNSLWGLSKILPSHFCAGDRNAPSFSPSVLTGCADWPVVAVYRPAGTSPRSCLFMRHVCSSSSGAAFPSMCCLHDSLPAADWSTPARGLSLVQPVAISRARMQQSAGKGAILGR